MDNSPEGHNKPDLGEGIKPEDVVFSSQDILGKSVAKTDRNFFTRVKAGRTRPEKQLEKQPEKKPEKKPEQKPRQRIKAILTAIRTKLEEATKTQQIIAIVVLSLVIIAIVAGLIFITINVVRFAGDMISGADNEAQEEIYVESEDYEENFIEDGTNYLENPDPDYDVQITLTPEEEELIDQRIAENMEKINSVVAAPEVKFDSQIEVAKGFADQGAFDTATSHLEEASQTFDRELTSCENVKLYEARVYVNTKSNETELAESNQALVNKYREECNANS